MGTQAQENGKPGTAEWETPVRLVGDIGCGWRGFVRAARGIELMYVPISVRKRLVY